MKLKKRIITLLIFMTIGTSLYATEKKSLAVNLNEWVLSNIGRQQEEILQLEQSLNEKIARFKEEVAVQKEAYHIELHELEEFLSSQSIEALKDYVALLSLGIEDAKKSALEFYEVKNAMIEESLIQEAHNATVDRPKEEDKETSEEDKIEEKEETSKEDEIEGKEETSEDDKEETSEEGKEETSEEDKVEDKEETSEEDKVEYEEESSEEDKVEDKKEESEEIEGDNKEENREENREENAM